MSKALSRVIHRISKDQQQLVEALRDVVPLSDRTRGQRRQFPRASRARRSEHLECGALAAPRVAALLLGRSRSVNWLS